MCMYKCTYIYIYIYIYIYTYIYIIEYDFTNYKSKRNLELQTKT